MFHFDQSLKELKTKNVLLIGLLLFIISALMRFPVLSLPDQVVFDEKYFGKFSGSYCCDGGYNFDLHPPHSKLLIAAPVALFTDYKDTYDWPVNGKYPMRDHHVPLTWMRVVPALFGSLMAPILFFTAILLGASWGAALFAGVLQVFENALILQTRLALLDGILVGFILLALCFYVWSLRQTKSRPRNLYLCLSGIFAGCAVGCKFTGLTSLGVILMYLVFRDSKKIVEADGSAFRVGPVIRVLASFTFAYVIGWVLDFYLVANRFYPYAVHWSDQVTAFFTHVVELHVRVLQRHSTLQTNDVQTSLPITWPMGGHSIYYWLGEKGGKNYFHPNQVVWGIGALAVLGCLILLIRRAIKKETPPDLLVLPTLAYLISYLPNFFITRPLYVYQYLPSASLSLICVAGVISELRKNLNPKQLKIGLGVLVLLVIGAFANFLYLIPQTYPMDFK